MIWVCSICVHLTLPFSGEEYPGVLKHGMRGGGVFEICCPVRLFTSLLGQSLIHSSAFFLGCENVFHTFVPFHLPNTSTNPTNQPASHSLQYNPIHLPSTFRLPYPILPKLPPVSHVASYIIKKIIIIITNNYKFTLLKLRAHFVMFVGVQLALLCNLRRSSF